MQLAKAPRHRCAQANGWAAAPLYGSPLATPCAEFDFSFLNFEQFASLNTQPIFLKLAVTQRCHPVSFIAHFSLMHMPLKCLTFARPQVPNWAPLGPH